MDTAEIHLVLGPRKKSVLGDSNAKKFGARGPGFEDTIDIDDWGFALTAKEDLSKGKEADTKGSSNRADVTDMTLTKSVDRSSTALMQLVASGEELTEATLYMLHRIEKSNRVVVRMADVKVTDYKIVVRDGDAVAFTETFTLSFNKIGVEYKSRDAKRGALTRGFATRNFEITLT